MLRTCYAPLVSSDPRLWSPEVREWVRFDGEVYQNPATIGECTFLSWWGESLIGFASYDPRRRPDCGVIGHNCILPEYQNRGAGKLQIREILRRFQQLGIRSARVSTLDIPFFLPARRMYFACGFHISREQPWPVYPKLKLLHFERKLEEKG